MKLAVKCTLAVLLLFPVLPLNVSAIALILLLLLSVASILPNFNLSNFPKPTGSFWIMSSIPLLYLVHTIISDAPDVAWFHFEKKLAWIVVPLIFYLLHTKYDTFQGKYWELWTALPGVLLALAAILIYAYSMFVLDIESVQFTYEFRTLLESLTQIHPTYLALITNASIFFLFKYYSRTRSFLIPIFSLIAIAIVGSILSGARAPLLGLILVFSWYVFSQLKLTLKHKSFAFVGMLALFFLLMQIPVISSRVNGIIGMFSTNYTNQETIETSKRAFIWLCDAGIIKEYWLTGVGTGEIQLYLNTCYNMFDMNQALVEEFNTHNEFANIWIGTGLLGFLVFCSFFVIYWKALKTNWHGKAILILFGTVCLTENLLERQHGVFFSALYLSLMLYASWFNPPERSQVPKGE